MREPRSGDALRDRGWRSRQRGPSTTQVFALCAQILAPLWMTGLLGEGAAGGFGGGGFVIRGIEDDAAVETFAIALGAEVG
jgi:hypothetical protein